MSVYTTNADLVKKRSNILELGIFSFDDQHEETERIINRDLSIWYDAEARLRSRSPQAIPFDQQYLLLSDIEIKPAAVFLALSLSYDLLSKDLPVEEDGMASQREHYRKEFEREWKNSKILGFTYDWDMSGDATSNENPCVRYRTLVRQ